MIIYPNRSKTKKFKSRKMKPLRIKKKTRILKETRDQVRKLLRPKGTPKKRLIIKYKNKNLSQKMIKT